MTACKNHHLSVSVYSSSKNTKMYTFCKNGIIHCGLAGVRRFLNLERLSRRFTSA